MTIFFYHEDFSIFVDHCDFVQRKMVHVFEQFKTISEYDKHEMNLKEEVQYSTLKKTSDTDNAK